MHIGNEIQLQREYRGMESRELAKMVNKSASYLSQITNDPTRKPRYKNSYKILDALGVLRKDMIEECIEHYYHIKIEDKIIKTKKYNAAKISNYIKDRIKVLNVDTIQLSFKMGMPSYFIDELIEEKIKLIDLETAINLNEELNFIEGSKEEIETAIKKLLGIYVDDPSTTKETIFKEPEIKETKPIENEPVQPTLFEFEFNNLISSTINYFNFSKKINMNYTNQVISKLNDNLEAHPGLMFDLFELNWYKLKNITDHNKVSLIDDIDKLIDKYSENK